MLIAAIIALVARSNDRPISPEMQAHLFPLSAVRIHEGPFSPAVRANREYLLALDCDRLLAPFRREAGLRPRKPSYENWENIGLDGHTAGHYLSALADMIGAGADTPHGELQRRLSYMIDELAVCQKANGDGYIGGIPGSRVFWGQIASGDVGKVWSKWAPWYNLHKTYAGLRDAYLVAHNGKAKDLLVKFGTWAGNTTDHLSETQMQQMLGAEQGGMNEVLADIYAITGNPKFLKLAQRFCHQEVLAPLERQEDRLTGLHANTQIPKVIGLARIGNLTSNSTDLTGAKFFWKDVTSLRSVAFGGNSVSEHFNDPKDFEGMLEHREGPETCNTYNMLRLTEQLFQSEPKAAYADYYERALFNHILASINPEHPGYVYFTPIRPGHYRVYSQPGLGMWCCSGTGMENPGRYGQFIYAGARDAIYVNLFIASELRVNDLGVTLKQRTAFPDEEATHLSLELKHPRKFKLLIRNPGWVAQGAFTVRVNGQDEKLESSPSSYAVIDREWKNGDQIDVGLPMRITVEGLPDGSSWYSLLHGPIVLAARDGTEHLDGLRAGDGRGDHIANGPLFPIDQQPALISNPKELSEHVKPDLGSGPNHFRLVDIEYPASQSGMELEPFYRLHDARYQMYWNVTTKQAMDESKAKIAAIEAAKIARDAATIDRVAIGEQQPETDHLFVGEKSETGIFNGRRWRHGASVQYTLSLRGAKEAVLAVEYSGQDSGRIFDILVNGQLITTEHLVGAYPGKFFEKRYSLPAGAISGPSKDSITVAFVGRNSLAGGIYDLRLLRPNAPVIPPSSK